jgi:hypothetical protein
MNRRYGNGGPLADSESSIRRHLEPELCVPCGIRTRVAAARELSSGLLWMRLDKQTLQLAKAFVQGPSTRARVCSSRDIREILGEAFLRPNWSWVGKAGAFRARSHNVCFGLKGRPALDKRVRPRSAKRRLLPSHPLVSENSVGPKWRRV